MKLKNIIIGIFIALLILVSYAVLRAFTRAGEFSTLTPRFDGTCQFIPNIVGAESIVLSGDKKSIYISSHDRAAQMKSDTRGAIYKLAIDSLSNNPERKDLTGGLPANFKPIGISVYTAPNGETTLMAVSGGVNGRTIDIFKETGGALVHQKNVKIDGAPRLNSVLALGPDSFYVTNESIEKSGSMGAMVKQILDTDKSGSIYYYNGTKAEKLIDGLSYANSLGLSPDGKKLYATGTVSRALFIYDRDTTTNAIKLSDEVFLGTGVDNIFVEETGAPNDIGRIWIASHPKLFTLLGHFDDPSKPSPSQVVVVEPNKDGKGGNVDQVYLSNGDDGFAAASVALRSGNKMIMGSIFEKSIRVCELPKVWHQSQSHPAQRLLDTKRDTELKKQEEAAKKAK